ncbi:MAG: RrF2 family transcriptional regulator [Acidimicrobiales bacterium]
MRISAKVDYAVRAMVELAASDGPVKAEEIADRQHIPVHFLLNILGRLKLAGLAESRRGSDGGYWLALDPLDISIADVIRAVEGPLADVHDVPPEELDYPEPAAALRDVWLATRAALRRVLEQVSIADVAAGKLPAGVADELADPGSWHRR